MATLLIMDPDRVNLENVEVGRKHWRSMVGATEGPWAMWQKDTHSSGHTGQGGSTTHCSDPIPKAPTPQQTYSATDSVSHRVV